MRTIFVTGTDTDVGKTFVSRLILNKMSTRYSRTAGFKPISAGCERTSQGLRNEDALILQQASTIDLDYNEVNPIAFAPPIAPHIAAKQVGVRLGVEEISQHYRRLLEHSPDFVLTEGAGGWRLPLSDQESDTSASKPCIEYLSDFAIAHDMPVVLVVGMRLGCLNHAVLTYEAIVRDGLNCIGWIANQCEPDMPYYKHNKQSLTNLLNAPMLAEVAYCDEKTPEGDELLETTAAWQIIFS
ncbi:dethiobiotin synthase [Agaribacter flavus]|uniref:ATP-dependent dethiobiotin synthetase BioD n=1 Tax=Agaribacter flavus TaxID=1902781 RepID=A0ABV7FP75_9ALTE